MVDVFELLGSSAHSKQSNGNKGDAANPAYQSSNPGGTYQTLQYFAFSLLLQFGYHCMTMVREIIAPSVKYCG
jgi:hypothetical protein